MTWGTAAMFVCGIVVAWMVISILSAIWYGKVRERQHKTRLRVEMVHSLKKHHGMSHNEAMDIADKHFQ